MTEPKLAMKSVTPIPRFLAVAALLGMALLFQGCASRPAATATAATATATAGVNTLSTMSEAALERSTRQANPADPFESFNRSVFRFNEGLDRAILKPVAIAYREVLPRPVRTGVTNFFGNIQDVWSGVNNLLQAKPAYALDSLFRVSVNTVWGIGGIFDVASDMRIPKHSEDFGQTLGYWGMKSGPYLVLPVLGPSSIRDSLAMIVDTKGNLVAQSSDVPLRNSLTALGVVNVRSNLLRAGDVLGEAALDKYSFARDTYLQRRESLVGSPKEEEERFDLPEASPPAAAAIPGASGVNPVSRDAPASAPKSAP